MDTTVKRIRPKDYELSVVQDNLADVLQQILDSIKATGTTQKKQITLEPLLQQLRGPGTTQTIQTPALLVHGDSSNSGGNTIVLGDPATGNSQAVPANIAITGDVTSVGTTNLQGPVNINGTMTYRGQTMIYTKAQNGFIIQPAVTGPAFYVTNMAGTLASFQINEDGSFTSIGSGQVNGNLKVNAECSANTMRSNQGFKSFINCGVSSRGMPNAAGIIRSNTASGNPFNAPQPFAGSIMGISLALNATVNQSITVQVFKNVPTAVTGMIIDTGGIPANALVPPAPITFAKGQFPFNAGDYLGMGVYCGGGAIFNANCGLVVEYGA